MRTVQRCWWMARFALVALLITATAGTSYGQTPLPNPGRTGVLSWPKDTGITIWVPPDPRAADFPERRDALIEGIRSWFTPGSNASQTAVAQLLAERGITATVASAAPPPGTPNISVDWTAPTGTTAGKLADTSPSPKPGTDDIASATIHVDPAQSTDPGDAYKLGAHETGHALGLDHPGTGADPNDIMNDPIPNIGPSFVFFNLTELRSVYLATRDDTHVEVIASATAAGERYVYQYSATWLSGGPLADFEINTNGAAVFDIGAPTGWMVDSRALPSDVLLAPGDPPETFLDFVHAREGLYLDAAHPLATFQFTSLAAPGPTQGFLNGTFETIGPAAPIPELPPIWLIALGCFALMARNVRRSRSACGIS
jgi:hypothetical protein